MTAILTSLFISLGLAPVGAKNDPCLMPAWTTGHSVAFACDFEDAVAADRTGSLGSYTGRRTGAVFNAAQARGKSNVALIVSDRVVPVNDAPKEAAMLGAFGGWIDGTGRVHGNNDSWTMQIASTSASNKPAGTLVTVVLRDGQQ